MDRLLNPFKQALKSGRLQIGLWHSLASHLVVEILADSGFDWILMDTEHAPNEVPMVLAQLQAMSGGTAAPSRPPGLERSSDHQAPARRRRAVASRSPTSKQRRRRSARSCRSAIRRTAFAASPRRRAPRATAGSRDTTRRPTREICLLLQVETKRGLENLDGSQASTASTAYSSGRAIFRPRSAISASPLTPRSSRRSTMRFAESRTPAGRPEF